jgi:hypothetical protein
LFALGHDARSDSKMERVWIDSRRLADHTAIATALLLCRFGQWASSCSCLAEMLNDEVVGARAVRDYLAHDSGLHHLAQYWTKHFYDDLAANVSPALRNVCIVGAGSQEFLASLFSRSHCSLDSQMTLLCDFLNGLGRTPASPLYNSWRRCLGADGTLARGEIQVTLCSCLRWKRLGTPSQSPVLANFGLPHMVSCSRKGCGCAPRSRAAPSLTEIAFSTSPLSRMQVGDRVNAPVKKVRITMTQKLLSCACYHGLLLIMI